MDNLTLVFYESDAHTVAARYDAVPSPVEPYFSMAFPRNCRVLDVGAGSGRDLARLHALGYKAFGIEPAAALRAAAIAQHPEISTRLEEGSLPSIGIPFGGEFDGVVCCAVLMHLPDTELLDAAIAIRNLLKPHGRLLLSLPASRGDKLEENRDKNGRLFMPYTAEEISLLFDRIGFQCIGRWNTSDVMSREGTSWYTLLLERQQVGIQRPIDQIESILNRDKKEATYKFALIRALAEIATQEPRTAVWFANGEVGVSIRRIANFGCCITGRCLRMIGLFRNLRPKLRAASRSSFGPY